MPGAIVRRSSLAQLSSRGPLKSGVKKNGPVEVWRGCCRCIVATLRLAQSYACGPCQDGLENISSSVDSLEVQKDGERRVKCKDRLTVKERCTELSR